MANDSASVKDAKTGLDKDMAMYRRDENGNPIYVQQISLVDPTTREAVPMAQEATLQALLTATQQLTVDNSVVDSIVDDTTSPGFVYEYWTTDISATPSDAVWVVSRYEVNADALLWADGNKLGDNAVTDLTALTYAEV